ncbi:recombinase family protein [Luteitalea sp.]|uniref:recombinase family protein n=1 Tax=Luteitalea sp. TaxID=2004800 RepID=UPI0025C6DF3E|nr:recombinase family protein [Luteitalea sp.]
MRVALYARYSSDLQHDKSIKDQLRELREHVAQQDDWVVVITESDAELTAMTLKQRHGLGRVRREIQAGNVDILLTEDPKRLSRNSGEGGHLFDELKYHGVRWITLRMGEMDSLTAGIMAAVGQHQLEELKHYTRRGQRGNIADGRAAGGLSFGYRLDRSKTHYDKKRGQEVITRGVLIIDIEQAAIVVRIFKLFVAGLSSKAIAKLLNSEGIRGPRGRVWRPSTIHGNAQTGTGILNNELYIGRLVYGRREYRLNPKTGLRGKAVMNPVSTLTVKDLPHLRIIDDDLWAAVKARQADTKRAQRDGIDKARRPKFLFSKLTRCAICDGGFTTESRDELRCVNHTAGACDNSRVIKRSEVERRALVALQEKFLTPDRLEKFSREFVAEANRIRAESQSKLVNARRELEGIDRRQMQILGYLNAGFGEVESWKAEVRQNELRRAELQAVVTAASTEPTPPVLHASMAVIFENKVRQLAAALSHDDIELRESARSTLRGFIDRIVIPPGDDLLRVVGRLGEMLTAAGAKGASAAVGNVGCGGGI